MTKFKTIAICVDNPNFLLKRLDTVIKLKFHPASSKAAFIFLQKLLGECTAFHREI